MCTSAGCAGLGPAAGDGVRGGVLVAGLLARGPAGGCPLRRREPGGRTLREEPGKAAADGPVRPGAPITGTTGPVVEWRTARTPSQATSRARAAPAAHAAIQVTARPRRTSEMMPHPMT